MKKQVIILGILFMSFGIACAEESGVTENGASKTIEQEVEQKDSITNRVAQETKKYIDECSQKVYPKNLEEVNIYSDDIKRLDHAYHQCLKKIIINKVKEMATEDDAAKMVQSLEMFQDSILNFYWDLYNRDDYGLVGQGMNDAALGRYYEKLLEDIIHFQSF